MNPNFNRELLQDDEPQPQDAQTFDSTDLPAQYRTEPYLTDHGAEVQFGGTGAVPTRNQPTAAANYPATAWQEEYGGGGERYSGRGMYVEENGGYHSLPMPANRPLAAAEMPAPPPPPPPPNPCEFNAVISVIQYVHISTLIGFVYIITSVYLNDTI